MEEASDPALRAEGVKSNLPVQRRGRPSQDTGWSSHPSPGSSGWVNTEESQVCRICNSPRRGMGGAQEQKTNLCQMIVLQIFKTWAHMRSRLKKNLTSHLRVSFVVLGKIHFFLVDSLAKRLCKSFLSGDCLITVTGVVFVMPYCVFPPKFMLMLKPQMDSLLYACFSCYTLERFTQH